MSMAAVAIGTVVSVGAAAAGTAMSVSAANKAAAAQGRLTGKSSKELKKIQEQVMAIPAPQWNIQKDIGDARRVTTYNIGELERIFPGAKTSREIAGQTAIAYQKGEIPKDVRDSIMRSVAELGGAGFTPPQGGVPQAGGFQAAQGLLSRQLGLQSVQLSQLGNQISQGWQALAGSFIESPLQVGQARLGFEKAAADVELAKLGMAQEGVIGRYGMQADTIGSRLAASQALASGITSTGQALGSGISAYGSALGAAKAAGTGSTAMTNQGFYKDQIGAANQFNVAPSQLSYQKGSGGFLGMGGQQGGYYYNPSGQYGRADISRNIVFGG